MNRKRNFLILLMFVCSAFFAVAQSNRDTLVYVYTPNDTILLSQASADIIVHTSASANGDGGFSRYTSVQLSVPTEMCERLDTADIQKFVLVMGNLRTTFQEFRKYDGLCRYFLVDRDDGVRWTSIKYRLGGDGM